MINIKSLDESQMRIYISAYEFYCAKLNKESKNIDIAIKEALNKTMVIFEDEVEDSKKLREYLNQEISMIREQKPAIFISDKEVRNFIWWDEYRKDDKNRTEYWTRYERYLKEDKCWDRSAIERSIDVTTDKIMNAIADPNIKVPIERKGMVIGYIQSGKTAHYIGLINKAIDAGYKIIIILAGMYNNLRSQTQSRIDEEVLGFETSLEYLMKQMQQVPNVIGVGAKYTTSFGVQTLTTRDQNGDFNGNRAQAFISPENTTIFIVKKNYKVLDGLITYFKKNQKRSIDSQTGRKYMDANYPLLLIDDEADQASVNTKYEYRDGILQDDNKLSKINEQIRDLFHIFDCRSYVGYTATPYANIFIPNQIDNSEHGKDLFPTHFILSLPKPSNYIGAHEFFGEEDNSPSMPLWREVKNESLSFVDNKKKIVLNELPQDLKKAIQSFLISTSIRICRGETKKPNTMLIHVTRLTDIQKLVHIRVIKYFELLSCKIIDGNTKTINELKDLWEKDYILTTKKMKNIHSSFMQDVSEFTWQEIFCKIKILLSNDLIKIYSVNGKSKDSLLYKEHKGKQYNVIAIGGDKLSRGLTLEGLTVSYFTRESKMYDTLMQMGRWFGFRPGYIDLCRLYVTKELFAWFKHISFATEDLREQIEFMNNIEETPENFGLRVATHPYMKISNAKKVQTGEERYITFSNVFSQTRSIDIDADKYNNNFAAVNELLTLCGEPVSDYWMKVGRVNNKSKHLFWRNVDGHYIANFLLRYKTSKQANKANSKYMSEYIEDQMKHGGLVNWTICLVNTGDIGRKIKLTKWTVASGMERKNIYKVTDKFCSIQTLTPEDYQFYDLDKNDMKKIEKLKDKFKLQGKNISNDYIRKEVRKRENGFLIICPIDTERGNGRVLEDIKKSHKVPIGIAIVFPDNENIGKKISYRINEIGLKGEEDEYFG